MLFILTIFTVATTVDVSWFLTFPCSTFLFVFSWSPRCPEIRTQQYSRALFASVTVVQQQLVWMRRTAYPGVLPPVAVGIASSILADDSNMDLLAQSAPDLAVLAKKLRVVSLASSRLGHRSCHALWGPTTSCKETVLESAVSQLRRAENVLVMSFNGDTLQSDDDAVLQAALEIKRFLSSSSSSKLRAKHSVFRQRSFPFAVMMKFSGNSAGVATLLDEEPANVTTCPIPGRKRARDPVDVSRHSRDSEMLNRSTDVSTEAHMQTVIDFEGGAAERTTSGLLPLPGPTVLTRPSPAALGALQDALVTLTRSGVGIVVAIQNVARFSVWCDRTVYLLSGLMHDAEESGAGMALLLTSLTPDLRHTEKRLSSRLTSEMWFVPPPHVSVPALLEVVLLRTAKRATEDGHKVATQIRECQQHLKQLSCTVQANRRKSGNRARGAMLPEHEQAVRRCTQVESQIGTLEGEAKDLRAVVTSCNHWVDAMREAAGTAGGVGELLRPFVGVVDASSFAFATSQNWDDVVSMCRMFLSFHGQQCGGDMGHREASNRNTAPSFITSKSTMCTRMIYASGGVRSDLLDSGLLVHLGYGSRELMFLLAFCWMRSESGILRSLDELVLDIQSTMPSSLGMKSIVHSSFRAALAQLISIGIVEVDVAKNHAVMLRRDRLSCKMFLQDVLRVSGGCWEDAGLTLQDRQQLSHLVR